MTPAVSVGFVSERRLSVEGWEEGAGAVIVVEAEGKNGWRKATAAAIFEDKKGFSWPYDAAGCTAAGQDGSVI